MTKLNICGEEINYSSRNKIIYSDNKAIITLGTAVDEGKEYPCAAFNMQTDYANFESLAFAIWSVQESCEIELEFQRSTEAFKLPVHFDLSNLYNVEISTRINHFMRFLYRVWKMKTQYPKFHISEKNKADVERFAEQYSDALEKHNLQYSAPDGKAGIKQDTQKIAENHLEKWFVMNGLKKEFITRFGSYSNTNIKLRDQLPCGIFYGQKAGDCHKATRIFNGGAIDLWGINDIKKRIDIFELKEEKNVELGMISELFFYSCVIGDILSIGKGNRTANHRGFSDLWNEEVDREIIGAYFLLPELKGFFKEAKRMDEIIRIMNKRKDKKVEYGYILFNQNKITEKGIANIICEWKSRTEERLYK